MKPFHSQHLVRAFFGDPRTVFRSAHHADLGTFSFHNGIDIVASDGSAVYPVVSGVVVKVKPDEIVVESASENRTFQYWHLLARVKNRDRVIAQKTVLGTVQAGRGHVHLTEIDGTVVENPLQPGHLTPYQDRTAPSVIELFFHDRQGRALSAQELSGSVELTAAALDRPPLPLPGPWSKVAVSPARISWYVSTLDGRQLLPEQVPADFSSTVPVPSEFWSVYSKGTYQNFPAVGQHYFYGTPGEYLFNLTPSRFNTRWLAAGLYRLTVAAADTCGNRGTLSEIVRVRRQSVITPLTGSLLTNLPPGEPSLRPIWPHRFWTVVLGPTWRGRNDAEALRLTARAGEARLSPLTIVTSPTGRATKTGISRLVTGRFGSWAGAYTAAQAIAPRFPGAYAREIVLRPWLHAEVETSISMNRVHDRARYGVILRSVPIRAGISVARALSFGARAGGLPAVRILPSARYKYLRPGYLVVVSGRYRTVGAAARAAQLAATLYPSAYARELIPGQPAKPLRRNLATRAALMHHR